MPGDISPLIKFAYLGGPEPFAKKLLQLSRIAEKENWYYDSPNARSEAQKELSVLFQYVHHTFSRAQDENKVLEKDNCAMMNTGLFTPNGEEIYALFTPNRFFDGESSDKQKWFLDSFLKESSMRIPESVRSTLPDYVDYFGSNPQDMYFDPKLKIIINRDHIIDDNFDRLPPTIQAFPIEVTRMLFDSAERTMKKRISRNNWLVIPQYFNKKIAYLAPLIVANEIIPLAIEKNDNTYRVNTILTKGMAYCNARLLMRPESNWLINNERETSH